MGGSNFLKATGGLIAAGAALFGGQAGYQVWTAEQECRHFRNQSAEHANVIQQSKSEIIQQEAQTEELFVVRRDQQQAVSIAEAQVTEAQQRLMQLEQDKAELDTQLRKTQEAVLTGKQRVENLREEVRRRTEARTLAEKALTAANQHAQEVRANVNPLQHPLVREYFGRR
ncbi:hypothetical protein ABBQ32_007836 [Trebouxia sp. C0010 RCD-2024]